MHKIIGARSQEPGCTSDLNRPGGGRGRHRPWGRSVRVVVTQSRRAAGLVLAYATLVGAAAEAQTTLVSNVGQTRSGSLGLDTHEGAQAFTTGDNSDGYTVTSVGLDMSSGTNPTFNFTVEIWTNSNSNLPGSSLVTLTPPASLTHPGVNEFTTSGIELAANTTYWVVVDSDGGGNIQWEGTAADSEDSTSASGWSIADESYDRPFAGGTWNSYTDPFKLRVTGTAIGSATNNAPTFTEGTSTTRSVAENTASGQNIGVPVTATDADTSDTLTYTLGGTDASSFSINNSTGQLQTSAALDYETKASYAVTVSVSDGNGGGDSINVTINVTADRAALVALYNATGGANWTINTNWLTNAALSEWHRVETDEDGRVTALRLVANGLTGEIPVELGDLANLERLDLLNNGLSGEIPAKLGDLANLELLYLHRNELSGEIPEELGSLANLQYLYLNENELTGEIPAELGQLANLQELFLWGNELSGTIPAELGNLANLQYLYLNENELTGEIPPELGDLTNLQYLYLNDNNELSGEIPAELGDLANLQEFDIRNTGLCAPTDTAFQAWLATINFQGAVCAVTPPPPPPPPPPPKPTTSAPGVPSNLTAVGGDGQVVLDLGRTGE